MELKFLNKIIKTNDICFLKNSLKNDDFDPSSYNNQALRYACMYSKNDIFDILIAVKD